jgi:Pyruvate/2-oxoacid:ferredoxin oxidoreductase gamma subunit
MAIEQMFSKKGKDMVELNLKALRAGREYAEKRT